MDNPLSVKDVRVLMDFVDDAEKVFPSTWTIRDRLVSLEQMRLVQGRVRILYMAYNHEVVTERICAQQMDRFDTSVWPNQPNLLYRLRFCAQRPSREASSY